MKREDVAISVEEFKKMPTKDAFLTYVHYVDDETVKLGYLFIDNDGTTTFDISNFVNCPATDKMIKDDLVETYRHIIEINDENAYHFVKERSYELYQGRVQAIRYFLGSLVLLCGPIMSSYAAYHLDDNRKFFGGLLAAGIVLTGLDGYLFCNMLHSISFNKQDEEELNQYIEIEAKSRMRFKKGDKDEKKNAN